MADHFTPLPGAAALTLKNNKGRSNVLLSPARVRIPDVYSTLDHSLHDVQAIWDTGATNTVMDRKLVAKMGLPPTGITLTRGVHGEKSVNTYILDVILLSGVEFPGLQVTEGEISDPCQLLIGMDIIGSGDFAVTLENGHTVFSFRTPACGIPIDYVARINEQKAKDAARAAKPEFWKAPKNFKKKGGKRR